MQTVPDRDIHPGKSAAVAVNRPQLADAAFRRYHWTMLVLCAAVVVLALSLRVLPNGRVAFWFLPQLPLPESCMWHTLLGVHCPGCGLTRSFVYLAHGRFRDAWQMHRLGWLLALALLAQFPYRLAALFGPSRQPLGRAFPKYFGVALIVLLVADWVMDLFI